MAAPFILKVREELGLKPDEAAEVLKINVQDYLALESNQDKHFERHQLIALWNWMTPKM